MGLGLMAMNLRAEFVASFPFKLEPILRWTPVDSAEHPRRCQDVRSVPDMERALEMRVCMALRSGSTMEAVDH